MIKLRLSVITIIFLLFVVANTTSKYTGVSWNKNHKKWEAQLIHNKKQNHGGYFDNEKHAAMKVNLLCDKYEIARKNPMINIDLDQIQRIIPNKASKYIGVYWSKNRKSWKVELKHNKKRYYGGCFDDEEHAAKKVNLLCDKFEIERKNPTVNLELDVMQKVKSETSKYNGVCWDKNCKKWRADLKHTDRKQYFGGYFDTEEYAAMKINLLCDKYEIQRKNPLINIKPDAIQKIPNQTSIYTGVTWNKKGKCWQTQLQHNKKHYYGGLFDKEEHAAMKINSICDTMKIQHKNPEINKNIIQKKTKSEMHQYATENIVVKEEDKNILHRFKNECENRFTQQNNGQKRCTAAAVTKFQNSDAKRKRKQNDDVSKEVKEENVWFDEKIEHNYTKM